MRFTAFTEDAGPATRKAWRFNATPAWFRRHDNGCSVSIGFRVPSEITEKQLKSLKAVEIPWDEWAHSGCQSGCVRRGDTACCW